MKKIVCNQIICGIKNKILKNFTEEITDVIRDMFFKEQLKDEFWMSFTRRSP